MAGRKGRPAAVPMSDEALANAPLQQRTVDGQQVARVTGAGQR